MIVADVGQLTHQRMCQVERQRHVIGCLVAGIAEHHTLVTGTLVGLVLLVSIHTLGDVAALLVHAVKDAARVGIKLILALGVADFLDHLACRTLQVDVNVGGHLAGDDHLTRRHQRLACHMGIGVKGQELVQNGVTDLVGDFVGMTL